MREEGKTSKFKSEKKFIKAINTYKTRDGLFLSLNIMMYFYIVAQAEVNESFILLWLKKCNKLRISHSATIELVRFKVAPWSFFNTVQVTVTG